MIGAGRKFLWILTAAVLAVLVALYIYGWINALACPLSLGYEGANLYIATKLAEGINIYDLSTLHSAPWSVTIYPPLYFVLVAPFQQVFGWNLWSGRLVSILSLLVTGFASYRVFRLSGSTRLVSTIALSTLLSYLGIWSWSFFGRVDMLSMAFSALALERFLSIYSGLKSDEVDTTNGSMGESKSNVAKMIAMAWTYRMPIIISVLAVFSKQPSVVVPAAISFFLLFRGRKIEAISFGLTSFLACLIILLVLNISTGGGFLPHMQFLSKAPVQLGFLGEHILWFGLDLLKLIILPVLALMWYLSKRSEKQDIILLPIMLFMLTGVITIYTLGTEYAHINHAFHLIFALAWLSAELARPCPLKSGFLMLGSSAAAVSVIAMYGTSLFFYRSAMAETIDKLGQLNLGGQVILTEDPAIALAAGAKPLFVDLASFIQVWKGQGGSMDQVIAAIKEKKYPYAIVNAHDAKRSLPYLYWSKAFIDAVWQSYEKRDTLIGYRKRLYYFFVPKTGIENR